MSQSMPKPVRLSDYRPPDYLVEHVDLVFELSPRDARVTSRLSVRRNGDHSRPLNLNGEELRLESLAIDGETLDEARYRVDEKGMSIDEVPAAFELTVVNRVDPVDNTALDGLYQSSGNFCTQ